MKLWGGRFKKDQDNLLELFNNSISFDKTLYKWDIKGSKSHAKMLNKIGILEKEELRSIIDGLNEIHEEIENGDFEFKISDEDIHMAIEGSLIKRIGSLGKKLHTARSRNDQVAVDFKMYLLNEITEIKDLIKELLKTLSELSKEHINTIMPGYTHLQRAQPIRLSYHLMAYFQMFKRDYSRLTNCFELMNECPLGAGALAGTSYETDREYTANLLGFNKITENAMDSVSDRDFAIEFLSAASIIMMHLSRFCEELILWCSSEFGFVEMDDSFSTGSSIMPQKKNPDAAELIRGKTGRVFGSLITLLTVMKGLPLAYNKDMQEDKEPVFDTVETIKISLQVFEKMIDTINFNKEKMLSACKAGFLNATDMADYLVKKGLEFRQCHEIVGSLVSYAIEKNKTLEELSLKELRQFSDKFEDDIYRAIDIEACVEAKKSFGSTSEESVTNMIREAEKWLKLQ